jgi:hypothetical protein
VAGPEPARLLDNATAEDASRVHDVSILMAAGVAVGFWAGYCASAGELEPPATPLFMRPQLNTSRVMHRSKRLHFWFDGSSEIGFAGVCSSRVLRTAMSRDNMTRPKCPFWTLFS